ncbi:hypothetical protein [Microcystis aeruginosa]|nr:hypothetical protein [Microcystis aeruginosa]
MVTQIPEMGTYYSLLGKWGAFFIAIADLVEVTPLVTPLTPSSPSNFLAPVSAGVSDNLANQSDSLLSTPLLVNQEAANFSFSDQDTS